MATWDGSGWTRLGTQSLSIGGFDVDDNGMIYAVGGGRFANDGALGMGRMGVWDGENWVEFGSESLTEPALDSGLFLFALAVNTDGIVYVSGYFNRAGGIPSSRIASWIPSSAEVVDTDDDGIEDQLDNCIFDSNNDQLDTDGDTIYGLAYVFGRLDFRPLKGV